MASKPTFVPAPPDEDREVIPQLSELVTRSGDRLSILRKVQRVQELKDAMKPLEREKDKLTKELVGLLGQHQVSRCMVGDIRVNYYASIREGQPRKELLLQNGVTMLQLKASTGPDKTIYTLRIGRVAQEEEGE